MESVSPCQKKRIKVIVEKLRAQLEAQKKIEQDRMLRAKVSQYENNNQLYIKTFLIDDKRNANNWRVSWNSIKKHAKDFVGKPGIEYTKCTHRGCMLDHADGNDYNDILHKQEKYRVSTIVDTVLDEPNHTAYAIHRVEDNNFAEKIKKGEVKYLSPAIWYDKEHTTMKYSKDAIHIDTTSWQATHDAFVHEPAYGQKANVREMCEGSTECVDKLRNN